MPRKTPDKSSASWHDKTDAERLEADPNYDPTNAAGARGVSASGSEEAARRVSGDNDDAPAATADASDLDFEGFDGKGSPLVSFGGQTFRIADLRARFDALEVEALEDRDDEVKEAQNTPSEGAPEEAVAAPAARDKKPDSKDARDV